MISLKRWSFYSPFFSVSALVKSYSWSLNVIIMSPSSVGNSLACWTSVSTLLSIWSMISCSVDEVSIRVPSARYLASISGFEKIECGFPLLKFYLYYLLSSRASCMIVHWAKKIDSMIEALERLISSCSPCLAYFFHSSVVIYPLLQEHLCYPLLQEHLCRHITLVWGSRHFEMAKKRAANGHMMLTKPNFWNDVKDYFWPIVTSRSLVSPKKQSSGIANLLQISHIILLSIWPVHIR